MENLTKIKCPLKVVSRHGGYIFTCGRDTRVSVAPGSKGEVWCKSCKQSFAFEVTSQYTPPVQPVTRIEVQREDT